MGLLIVISVHCVSNSVQCDKEREGGRERVREGEFGSREKLTGRMVCIDQLTILQSETQTD